MQISLKARLTIITSVLAVVLTIIVSLIGQFLAFRDLRDVLEEQQSSQVKLVAEQLDTKFEERGQMLWHTAAQLGARMQEPASAIATIVRNSLPAPHVFDILFVAQRDGSVVFSTNPRSPKHLNIHDRLYFQKAISTREVTISRPLRSRSAGIPVVYMAVPILKDDGTIAGVLGGALNLLEPNFLGRIAHHRIGITGMYCLVSGGEQALYVMHRDPEKLGSVARLYNERCGEDIRPTAYEFFHPIAPLASRHLLEKTGWELVAVVPADEAYAPLNAMRDRMLMVALVVAMSAAVIMWLVVWHFLAPLSRLRDVVRCSKDDHHAHEALVLQRHDEIGEVGREFTALMSELNAKTAALRHSEEELRHSESRMRNIANRLPSLVAYLDKNERYVFNNLAYEEHFKRPVSEIQGMTICELLGEAAYARIQPYLQRAFSGEHVIFDEPLLMENGTYLWTEATYQPQWDEEHREVIGIHILVRDVTEEKQEAQRLDALTQLDHLTGLANRKGFDRRLADAVNGANNDGTPFTLLYLDLDMFKNVNDSFGHACGDALLTTFSERLRACIRKSDMAARLGGDEFAVIIDDMNQPEHAVRVAQDIIDAARTPFTFDGHPVQIGVSIGIALSRDDGNTANAIQARADAALYQAKRQGRNQFAMDGASS